MYCIICLIHSVYLLYPQEINIVASGMIDDSSPLYKTFGLISNILLFRKWRRQSLQLKVLMNIHYIISLHFVNKPYENCFRQVWRKKNTATGKMPYTRPTTDIAKEGLFNILQNRIALEGIRTLDLFGGTGSISYSWHPVAPAKSLLSKRCEHARLYQKTWQCLALSSAGA